MVSDFRIVHRRHGAAMRKQQGAEIGRMLGWVILALSVIPALFIPVGLIAGSMFWPYWTLGQILLGCGVLAGFAWLRVLAESKGANRAYRPSTQEQAEFAAENYHSWAA